MLSDVIEYFSTNENESSGMYTVNRYAARAYDAKGRIAAVSAPVTLQISASIQPTNGRDLQVLQEADITSESRKVITNTLLFTTRPGQEPDEIIIDGEVWVAQIATRWQAFGENFYETLCSRKALV